MLERLEGDIVRAVEVVFIHLQELWIAWPRWLVVGTGARSEKPETLRARGSAEANLQY